MTIHRKGFLFFGLLIFWLALAPPGMAQNKASGGKSRQAVDPQQVQRMMDRMLKDPESLELIRKLEQDPEMQKILQDPELVKAVQEQDAARLAQDPKVQALQKNRNVRKLIERNR